MMESLPAVHLAGNCAVDLLVPTTNPADRARDRGLAAALEVLDESPQPLLAGCAGWPAYLLAGMGHAVQINARIGHDLFGRYLRDRLGRAGVELVGPEAKATAVSILSSGAGGLKTGLVYTGEPIHWEASIAAISVRPGLGWLFAAGYLGVNSGDGEALERVFNAMQRRQVRIVFDPGPWFADRVGKDALLGLLRMTHCLTATKEELGAWFSPADPASLAQRALDHGVECVAVKRGPDGAVYASRGGPTGHVATTPISGANTVGAGDTFNAGLLHGLSTGKSLNDAVACAVRIASEVVRVGRGGFCPESCAKSDKGNHSDT